ncbi:hypothetical protein MHYP_G00140140 [Metynnis hypsauchen]
MQVVELCLKVQACPVFVRTIWEEWVLNVLLLEELGWCMQLAASVNLHVASGMTERSAAAAADSHSSPGPRKRTQHSVFAINKDQEHTTQVGEQGKHRPLIELCQAALKVQLPPPVVKLYMMTGHQMVIAKTLLMTDTATNLQQWKQMREETYGTNREVERKKHLSDAPLSSVTLGVLIASYDHDRTHKAMLSTEQTQWVYILGKKNET